MTQDEIIEMATKVGLCCESNGFIDWIDAGPSLREMTLFAELVETKKDAEHKEAMRWDVHSCGPTCKRYACVATRKAVAAEREACAQVAFSWNTAITDRVAAEIRARGEA